MRLPWQGAGKDRIFISYRRSDGQGFAGRLADSLTRHFGSERVFRDVTGITYGQDFEKIIVERIEQACALVVVIGDSWLTATNSAGERRLDDPDDYVMREIAAALEGDVVVIPVLIGGATMPRKEELPPRLADLAQRNAITLSDERWTFDVERLAKVLAIDVAGSVTQGKLDTMRAVALAALLVGDGFAVATFAPAVVRWAEGAETLRVAGFSPLASAVPFFGIIVAGVMLLMALPLIGAERRKFAWAGVAVASVGATGPFIAYAMTNVAHPSTSLVFNFAAATLVTLVMLVLVSLAGFREK